VRFLSIDGGGSRGIVSIAFMEKLQQALDLSYPIQENFDFSIGTSSGESLLYFRNFELKRK
jgi:patatin-like phospholipase/acyl hydrolase